MEGALLDRHAALARYNPRNMKDNLAKKREIDAILGRFAVQMAFVKEKRDNLVNEFREVLRQKRIEEVKKAIRQ